MTDNNKWLAQLGAQEIREDTIDSEGSSYPYAQWVNGDAKLKQLGANAVAYIGGWFIPADKIALEALPGWTQGALSHAHGETEGWFASSLSMAVMHMRRCWQVGMGQGSRNYPWAAYDEAKAAGQACRPPIGPRGRLQILGIIKGLEDAGPIMLTMKGTTGMAFTDNDGILASFRTHVLKAAAAYSSKTGKRRVSDYPRFYFWMASGSELDAKGQPVFTKVGSGELSSMVTRPVLIGVTKGMAAPALGALYVGPELISTIEGSKDAVTGQWTHDGLYDDTEPWATGWETFGQAEPEAPVAEADFATEEDVPF